MVVSRHHSVHGSPGVRSPHGPVRDCFSVTSLYEVCCAMHLQKPVQVVLGPDDKKKLKMYLSTDFEQIVTLFTEVNSEYAGAASAEDKRMVDGWIRSKLGASGFQVMDQKVAEAMRPWLADTSAAASQTIHDVQLYSGCGKLLQHLAKHVRAEEMFRRALDLAEHLYGRDNSKVALCLNNLAGILVKRGKLGKAKEQHQKALDMSIAHLGRNHLQVGRCLASLGLALEAKGEHAEAVDKYRRALAITEMHHKDHPEVSERLLNLGGALQSQGNHDQAEPKFHEALTLSVKIYGPVHPSVASALNGLAHVSKAKGNYDKAEVMYKKALSIIEKIHGSDHPEIAQTINNIAEVAKVKGQFDRAGRLLQKTLTLAIKTYGLEHDEVSTRYTALAQVNRSKGDNSKAEAFYRKALAITESTHGRDSPIVVPNVMQLAMLLEEMQNYPEAKLLYRRALSTNFEGDHAAHACLADDLKRIQLEISGISKWSHLEAHVRRDSQTTAISEVVVSEVLPQLHAQLAQAKQSTEIWKKKNSQRKRKAGSKAAVVVSQASK